MSLVSVALLDRRVNRKSHRKSRLTRGDWGEFRIRVTRGVADRIVDLKKWQLTGWFHWLMRLDPEDVPQLVRDIGSDDIYALITVRAEITAPRGGPSSPSTRLARRDN